MYTKDQIDALALHVATRMIETLAHKCAWRPNCLDCKCFTEATELCSLANARPPARIIATGCQKFVDRDPPF